MLLDAARALTLAGCCVIPARTDGSKAPAVKWEQYQHSLPAGEQLEDWFGSGRYDGLGVVCGAVSGGLEMLELEGRAVHLASKLLQALADHGAGELWSRMCAGYLERSPSGGYHFLYRLDGTDGAVARGNTKLARRPASADEIAAVPTDKVKVLIETRGEGGFVITAPSGGRTHPTGAEWTLLAGGPATIPTITGDERDLLYAIASMFDEMPAVDPPSSKREAVAAGAGERPGDHFNTAATWDEILAPHGWKRTRKTFDGNGAAWTRPGKQGGVSATTGTASDGVDRLYVFSTSTEFETERPYSKFAAYAQLEHGGDLSAAAADLRNRGYGGAKPEKVTLTFSGPPDLRVVQGGGSVTSISQTSLSMPQDGTALPLALDQPGSDLPARIDVTLSDEGNAQVFVARHGERFRYVTSTGRWLTWDGSRWLTCQDDAEPFEAVRETIHAIRTDRDALRAHKTRSLSRRSLEAVIAIGRRDPTVRVLADRLDANPLSLCTPGGVVDLLGGGLTAASPDQLNTKLTGYPPRYDPPKRWLNFLEETFNGDAQMVGFVQRLAGYSATGLTTHHVLPFLHGAGGNGKSVFLDVMVAVLGDYATTAPAAFLMAGREQHETEIARLSGYRLVVCSEVNQHARFDEAKVKILTGGDRLTARFMRQDHFTFKPTHKLWLMGNHQPRVDAGGESFWRRLRLLPFTRVVPREQRIEGLAEQLVETEGPNILGWVVAGAMQALSGGLAEPDSVLAATEVYASEEDALAQFVADRCLLGGGPDVRVDTAEMRRCYEGWCRSEGEKVISPQVFGRELKSRFGVGYARANGRRFYANVSLIEPDEPEERPWYDQ